MQVDPSVAVGKPDSMSMATMSIDAAAMTFCMGAWNTRRHHMLGTRFLCLSTYLASNNEILTGPVYDLDVNVLLTGQRARCQTVVF